MGPRPDGRGKQGDLIRERSELLASMGPRPDGRGKPVAGGVLGRADRELQWGRGRMAAESYYGKVREGVYETLQWGRGRMAAERSCTS